MIARIWRRLRGTRQTPVRVALAVSLGLFIGCLPLYGLHFVLCLLVCLPLDLDLVLAYLVANISNPLLAPFLITLEVELGSLLTSGRHAAFTLTRARQTGVLGFVWQAGVGSVVVGGVLGALGGCTAYFVTVRRRAAGSDDQVSEHAEDAEDAVEAAMHRTLARYARAPRADRFQVAGKLRWDPVTKMLAALPFDFGRVLDAGAGRGQFGLFLLELGRCQSLRGFDGDPRKVEVAARAAGGACVFEVRDLLDLPAEPIDTLLFIDVLHYLPSSEQDELLQKASQCLPSGRLLIRDLDRAPGARSAITRAGEWLACAFGLHRGRARRYYRAASETVALLSQLGFSCEIQGASQGTPFGNVLIVAQRSAPRKN